MPTTSTSSSRAAAAISAGDEPDALVDDLEAGVAGGDGDLLGAVGVAVEARAWPPAAAAGPPARAPWPGTARRTARNSVAAVADPAAHPGRGPVLAEHLAERAGPLAGGAAGVGERDGGRHDVRRPRRPPAAARRGHARTAAVSRRRPPRLDVGAQLGLHGRVDLQDGPWRGPLAGPSPSSGERRSVSVKQLTPTTCCSPVSMRRTRSAWLRTSRALQLVDRLEGAAQREHVLELGRRRLGQLGRLRLDHRRAVEDVARTRAGPSRRPGSAGCAATTAGPRAGAGRGPRSRPAAAWPGPGPAWTG